MHKFFPVFALKNFKGNLIFFYSKYWAPASTHFSHLLGSSWIPNQINCCSFATNHSSSHFSTPPRNFWSAALQAHAPLMRLGGSQIAPDLASTAGVVECIIREISRRSSLVFLSQTVDCNKIMVKIWSIPLGFNKPYHTIPLGFHQIPPEQGLSSSLIFSTASNHLLIVSCGTCNAVDNCRWIWIGSSSNKSCKCLPSNFCGPPEPSTSLTLKSPHLNCGNHVSFSRYETGHDHWTIKQRW